MSKPFPCCGCQECQECEEYLTGDWYALLCNYENYAVGYSDRRFAGLDASYVFFWEAGSDFASLLNGVVINWAYSSGDYALVSTGLIRYSKAVSLGVSSLTRDLYVFGVDYPGDPYTEPEASFTPYEVTLSNFEGVFTVYQLTSLGSNCRKWYARIEIYADVSSPSLTVGNVSTSNVLSSKDSKFKPTISASQSGDIKSNCGTPINLAWGGEFQFTQSTLPPKSGALSSPAFHPGITFDSPTAKQATFVTSAMSLACPI